MLNAPERSARHSDMTFRMKTGFLRKGGVEKINMTSKMDMIKAFIVEAMSRNDNEYWTETMKTVPDGGSMTAGVWEDIPSLMFLWGAPNRADRFILPVNVMKAFAPSNTPLM